MDLRKTIRGGFDSITLSACLLAVLILWPIGNLVRICRGVHWSVAGRAL